jgi:hypothetical protein
VKVDNLHDLLLRFRFHPFWFIEPKHLVPKCQIFDELFYLNIKIWLMSRCVLDLSSKIAIGGEERQSSRRPKLIMFLFGSYVFNYLISDNCSVIEL